MLAWIAGAGPAVAALSTAIWLTVKRYRQSASKELMPITGYVVGSARLQFRRILNPAIARRLALRRYGQAILRISSRAMFVPSPQRLTLDIDQMYVRLTVGGAESGTISDSDLTDPALGTAIVFGEPGSGKSSMVRKLLRESALQAYLTPLESRMPIQVDLRNLAWQELLATERQPGDDNVEVSAREWIMQKVEALVADTASIHDPRFLLRSFLSGPGVFVLLDGLDEIPERHTRVALDALGHLIRTVRAQSPHSSVIVTSRTQLRDTIPRAFMRYFDKSYYIKPFSASDMFILLRRWPFGTDPMQQAGRIFSDLRLHPTLMEMCSNPLVLSMYIARDQYDVDRTAHRPVRLPETRTEFYSEVVRELLLFRREEQVSTGASRSLGDARRMFLGKLSYQHLMDDAQAANSLSFQEAVVLAASVLQVDPSESAEEIVRRTSVETGLYVEERRGETLRFMHLTLCEYLAAVEINDLGAVALKQVRKKVDRVDVDAGTESGRRLWETYSFAVSLAPRSRREEELQAAVADGVPRMLVLMAIRESRSYDLDVFRGLTAAILDDFRAGAGAPEQELSLLLSCLTDAKRLAAIRRIGDFPSALDVLEAAQAAPDSSTRLHTLFTEYLRIDPHAAVEFALTSATDRDLLNPERLALAMDNPELVSVGMEIAGSGRDDDDIWALSLCEAALTHQLAAGIIAGEPRPEGDGRSAATGWDRYEPITGSHYALALDAARRNSSRLARRTAAGGAMLRSYLVSTLDPAEFSGGSSRRGGRRGERPAAHLADLPGVLNLAERSRAGAPATPLVLARPGETFLLLQAAPVQVSVGGMSRGIDAFNVEAVLSNDGRVRSATVRAYTGRTLTSITTDLCRAHPMAQVAALMSGIDRLRPRRILHLKIETVAA